MDLLLDETFKYIHGFNEAYAITSRGRVYSFISCRFMAISVRKDGYCQIMLKGRVQRYIHRLVADHFLTPSPELEVNHIDGDKSNNNVSNLEFVSSRDNKLHAEKLGLSNHSELQKKAVSLASQRSNYESNPMIKISPDDASDICEAYDTGLFSYSEIANYFSVHKSTIFLIVKQSK
jgi:hypothetical protein